jgi:O-antigen ligase
LSITIAVAFASYFVLPTGTTRWIFYLGVLAPIVYLLKIDGPGLLARSRVWWLAAGLCGVSLASVLWSSAGLEGYFDAVREPIILALFLTGGIVLAGRQQFDERLVVGLVVVAAGISGLAVLALAGQPWMYWSDRLIGFGWTAKNPNVVGSLYGAAAVASIAVASRVRAGRWRIAALAIALICIACVVLSDSRAAMLGLLAAFCAFAFSVNWRILAGVIVGFLAVFAVMQLLGVTSIEGLIARGSNGRLDIWNHTLPMVLDTPWLGAGSATSYVVELPNGVIHNKAHNVFVATAYHLGALGLVVLVLLMACVAWSALKLALTGRAEYLAALTFGYVVLSLNSHTLVDQPQVSWFVFWLPTLLIVQREFEG